MQRYFIYLSFKGTAYCGWQSQPHSPSVQETLEKALSLFLRQEIKVTGAGRTDAGVHARLMVAHFDLSEPADPAWMIAKLNSILPQDIAVSNILPVQPDAHARFDAVARTYRYYVCIGKDPFSVDLCCRLYNDLDFALMNKAAALLLDNTDFTSFSKLHTDTRTNDCFVSKAEWTRTAPGRWVFTIRADRFLRNMVRAIVGTLFEVGRHNMTVEQFKEVIDSHDRCRAGDSAPAEGLYLEEIEYLDTVFV